MKRPQKYFVFNKTSDFSRGWGENITCPGDRICLSDGAERGVFWSRLLDSREKDTVWHRLTLECVSRGAASVRFDFYCAPTRTAAWRGAERDLGELLADPALTDEDRRQLSEPWLSRTALSPRDILLHDLTGRYLWFRVELTAQGGESPVVGNLKLRFPKETWMQYLPEAYQPRPGESPFVERYLSIFQSLYSDLDQEIRDVARCLDPDVVEGAYLEWLSGWLDVEDRYLWPQEKLRTLVRRGVELYRIRGTRRYVVEMVELYTGHTPWVVEHSDIEPFLTDTGRAALLKELYGGSPYMVTLILESSALESTEAYKALLRIIDNARPAWVEVNLVVLTPYLFLDKYSYLGINSTLDRYRPLHLNGSSALPFTRLGGEGEQVLST